jgi:ATP-binding cassette subfamily B multidrug efflux pump
MKHLFTLNTYFWKYRWHFFGGILFVVLTNYFRILSPQIAGYVVNSVTSSAVPSADKHTAYDAVVQIIIHWFESRAGNKIFFAALTLLAIAVISGFFMFLMRQTIIVMSRHIEYNQKNDVYQHYQTLDINFYKTHSTGDLMNRIAEDVSRVRMYTGPAIMYFINLAAVIVFSVSFMLKTNITLTLVALCPLPVLAIAIYWVNNIINKKSERIQSLLSDLTANAQESYAGIRVIKAFVQEKSMLGFFENNSEAYRRNALSLAKTEAVYFPSMALLIGLSTIITVMVGAVMVNKHQISVGTIAEFVLYIQMLTFPVSAIGWTASITQRAATSQQRINEFLLQQPAIKDSDKSVQVNLQGNIQFEGVSFTYPHTGIEAIKNFSLVINKGEKIAIIGKTGSGKSTIAQLLLRMYDAQQGNISYDGVPISSINLQSLRQQISYVPQDIFLFSDTIANNIKFSVADAPMAEIIKAAKQASIHEEIESFSLGYETMVGERGVTLSGGQKQRISIARALINEPEIVVFDDCLSAVDAKTEKEIIKNLYLYLVNKTAIIITHRVFSLFEFDKIVILEEGEIVEMGKHSELIAKNGYYAEMYAKQQFEDRVG